MTWGLHNAIASATAWDPSHCLSMDRRSFPRPAAQRERLAGRRDVPLTQVIACLRTLGVDPAANHVNPHGGAIALGHPLGMSGARLIMTAVHALEARGGRRALVTMCVGVGQGVAIAVERV